MAGNPALTIMQLELALNNMQNTMIKDDGSFALDDKFLELFDELLNKLKDTRALAESLRKK